MSNDNTLATVKHGGCVQLPTSERERFEAWARVFGLDVQRPEGSGWYMSPATMSAWSGWQAATAALSAQPSPGVVHPAVIPDTLVNGGALKMALNVLRRAGKNEVADELESTATTQPSPGGQDASGLIQDLRAAVSLGRPLLHSDVDEIAAALAARQTVGKIPAGFVLVPEKFGIPAEVWEGVEFVIGGPGTGEGEAYLDSTAWVGDLIQDDGSAVYGLHLSCDECPEEGSVTLSEFTARTEVQP